MWGLVASVVLAQVPSPRRGTVAAEMGKPTFIPPMLATLIAAPFDDPEWLFEVKWDGFRVEAVVDGASVQLWTRGEQDAARYFGDFLAPPTWLGARQAIVDGEVIALDESGEPDFALLQARIKGRGGASSATPFLYEVFDLLHLDGRALVTEQLAERRRLLSQVLRPDPRVRLSEHVEADGTAFFEAARTRGLEGIMARIAARRTCRASAPIGGRRSRSGPNRSWWSVVGRRAPARRSTSALCSSA